MMEQYQEEKYVCKLCNKSFLNEKVLGGHMRSHISLNSVKEDVKPKKSKMGVEADGYAGYGLRENPKKSWKLSDLKDSTTSPQENLCTVCGKGFESLRALFGHMRHHSRRERKNIQCKECGKAFETLRALTGHMNWHSGSGRIRVSNEAGASSSQKLVFDSQSESETTGLARRKRSKRTRHKSTQDCSFSELNESSSVTEIEQEVEEVAICLMMLSRGMHNWDEFNFVTEFLDNNSVSFEVKLPNQCKRIAKSEYGDFACDGDKYFRVKKPREEKLDSYVSDTINICSSEFYSETASDEEKKVGLEVPIERFYRGVEFKMPKLADESGILLYDTEIEKVIHGEMKRKPTEVASSEDLVKEVRLDQVGLETMKCSSSKKARLGACDPELGRNSCNKAISTTSDSDVFNDSGRKSEFKCKTCNKIFRSHQALGGHCTIHKRIRFALKNEGCEENIQSKILPEIEANCKLVKLECDENTLEEVGAEESHELKKSKRHECPICFKVFSSGQALGGHKRSHFFKLSETREQNVVVKQELTDTCSIFDLNLPATLEKQVHGDTGFKPWWVGNNHKPEPLVGLISN